MMDYLFTTQRLGFRDWNDSDATSMHHINTSPNVMQYFPSMPTLEETKKWIKRMQTSMEEKHYCYFAVEELDSGIFIGFIGLAHQDYEADFTPCTDIGWRLDEKYWGKGYATEGAKACLDYGFNTIGLQSIVSICPEINKPSENVMQKIGMQKITKFKHPKLKNYPTLENCLLYHKKRGKTSRKKTPKE